MATIYSTGNRQELKVCYAEDCEIHLYLEADETVEVLEMQVVHMTSYSAPKDGHGWSRLVFKRLEPVTGAFFPTVL